MIAADVGHPVMVDLLLQAGADVNRKVSVAGTVQTALMQAADSGHLEAVKLLVKAGADVNSKDHDEKTALTRAKEWGFWEFLVPTGMVLTPRTLCIDRCLQSHCQPFLSGEIWIGETTSFHLAREVALLTIN